MFQSLIQRWLAAQVKQAVQGAIFKEIQNGMAGGPKDKSEQVEQAGPTSGCDDAPDESAETEPVAIGMVFALPMEAAGVVDRLDDARTTKANGLRYHTGRFCAYRVAIVEAGMGREKAVLATERLIDVFRPERLLSAGYAGGLTSAMKRERLIVPARLIRDSDEATITLPGRADGEEAFTLLTTDRVVRTPAEKTELGKRFQADLVDMETYAIAEACARLDVPFLPLRVVLDTVDEEIAKDVQRIVDAGTGTGGTARMLGSVFGALLKRPSSLLDLYQLKERALIATDRLAQGIERLLKTTEETENDKIKIKIQNSEPGV